jgi:LAO/AO transport system kinase
VLLCSALEERGVDEVWTEIEGFRDEISAAGELAELRRRQAVSWMWSEVEETALDQLRNDPSVGDVVAAVESRVADGDLSPATAAHQILEAFRG